MRIGALRRVTEIGGRDNDYMGQLMGSPLPRPMESMLDDWHVALTMMEVSMRWIAALSADGIILHLIDCCFGSCYSVIKLKYMLYK